MLCAVCGVRRAVCTGVQCLPHLPDLMVDPFGNYLFQKLVEMCDAAARLNILRTITGASPPVAASVGPPTALEPVPVPSVDGTPSEAPSGVYGVCLGGSCGCAGCSVHRTCSAPFLWAVFARSWCGRSRCPVPSRFLPQRCPLPALPPASHVSTAGHATVPADVGDAQGVGAGSQAALKLNSIVTASLNVHGSCGAGQGRHRLLPGLVPHNHSFFLFFVFAGGLGSLPPCPPPPAPTRHPERSEAG